ncbi:hypothetical protein SLEP1_g45864 [Rubroshorea leprosula]|uniref:Pectinesterase inhibitor domain-containing protein n=1 Tax=Rubroshorea leprosula TaxID=152421 RepID=A0AAV5LKE0_9ROSI|nr:hypothetical protein SLEP1_g45864 [Rubroshorea leprosula]
MKHTISLLVLQIAFSSIFLPLALGDNTLIQTTCNKTPDSNLCTKVLQSDPRSSSATDVQGLAVIATDILAKNATVTLQQITSFFKTDPLYKMCFESYITVKIDIQVILEGVSKGNPKFAEQSASDVVTKADTCGKSIQSLKSDVGDKNKFVHDLALVVAAIVRLLL